MQSIHTCFWLYAAPRPCLDVYLGYLIGDTVLLRKDKRIWWKSCWQLERRPFQRDGMKLNQPTSDEWLKPWKWYGTVNWEDENSEGAIWREMGKMDSVYISMTRRRHGPFICFCSVSLCVFFVVVSLFPISFVALSSNGHTLKMKY